jgi:hypothetical protein
MCARKRGVREVNFPQPDTDEVPAVPGVRWRPAEVAAKPEGKRVEATPAAAAAEPAAAQPAAAAAKSSLSPRARYYGVVARWQRFRARARSDYLGTYDTSEEAAQAVDGALRRWGVRRYHKLNFPANKEECDAVARGEPPKEASSDEEEEEEEEEAPRCVRNKRARSPRAEEEDAAQPNAAKAPRAQPAAHAGGSRMLALPPPPPPPSHIGVLTLPPPAALALSSMEEDDDDVASTASFLRTLPLPLARVDAAVAAVRGSGVTLERLDRIASASIDKQERLMLLGAAAGALGINTPGEQLMLALGVLQRAHQERGGGGGGGGGEAGLAGPRGEAS